MLNPDEKEHPSPAEAAAPNSDSPAIAPEATTTKPQSLKREIRVWTRDLLIAIGLALVIIVLINSAGTLKPVAEPIHWMAWGAAFPAGASAVALILMAAMLIATVVVAVVLWIIVISIMFAILGAILGALFGGR